MKLIDRKGKAHEVDVGLVDRQGAFFLLLDDNEPTTYLRFSSQSALITSQQQEIRRLRSENEFLRSKLENSDVGAAKNGRVAVPCAAMLLGYGVSYVHKLIKAGELDSWKFKNKNYVSLSSLERFQLKQLEPDA